jgi:hypothetical protein
MRIEINNEPAQVELIRAMGSKDLSVSREALEAFAAFIGPVVQKVINTAGTVGTIYKDSPYDEDDSPSYPLDLLYNEDVDYITTWSQSMPGGLPTNQIEGVKEMKISTYRLDTAISFLKKYARRSRLDVVSKALERMAQEILIKQERNGWAVVLRALAEANTKSNKHVIAASTESVFNVADLSRLITRVKRINASWDSGTPAGSSSKGLTDLYVSPEIKEQIRGFAYNPMNTIGSQSTGPVPLPETVREGIFRAAGAEELYGVVLTDLNELGTSRKYNYLFQEFAAGDTDFGFSGAFDATTDEILVGFDLSRDAFIRAVARQSDSGGQFVTLPDDQWVSRSEKIGLYGYLEEGRVCVDSRGVVGIVV